MSIIKKLKATKPNKANKVKTGFKSGNKYSTGRPRGSKNKATQTREKLISTVLKRLTKKKELDALDTKDLLRSVIPLVNKETNFDHDDRVINIKVFKYATDEASTVNDSIIDHDSIDNTPSVADCDEVM